jgi:hypothetical protein
MFFFHYFFENRRFRSVANYDEHQKGDHDRPDSSAKMLYAYILLLPLQSFCSLAEAR